MTDKNKDIKIGIRISSEEKEDWDYYSTSIGCNNLSKFIRDSINKLITEARKPEKKIVIIE